MGSGSGLAAAFHLFSERSSRSNAKSLPKVDGSGPCSALTCRLIETTSTRPPILVGSDPEMLLLRAWLGVGVGFGFGVGAGARARGSVEVGWGGGGGEGGAEGEGQGEGQGSMLLLRAESVCSLGIWPTAAASVPERRLLSRLSSRRYCMPSQVSGVVPSTMLFSRRSERRLLR